VSVGQVHLEACDAVELNELLAFVGDWFAGDPDLGPSLRRHVGSDVYGLEDLRSDVSRFSCLLDGESGATTFGSGDPR
jgi:hypothetical protein